MLDYPKSFEKWFVKLFENVYTSNKLISLIDETVAYLQDDMIH